MNARPACLGRLPRQEMTSAMERPASATAAPTVVAISSCSQRSLPPVRLPGDQLSLVERGPALEVELDQARQVEQLGQVAGQRVSGRVGGTGERRDDHRPARQPQPPRPHECQSADADEREEGRGGQARPAEAVGVLEGARQADGPAQPLVDAHQQCVADRPRGGGVAGPLERPARPEDAHGFNRRRAGDSSTKKRLRFKTTIQ
jgi:hypothetical protein